MNTSLANHDGKLLVDIEHGRVLRCDDSPTVTERYLNTHPFIFHCGVGDEDAYFAGPDAQRAARNRAAGQATRHLDVIEYGVLTRVGTLVTLQRKVDA